MKKLFLVFVTVASMSLSMSGCGARMEVAKDQALKKLDEMLGTMEVRRKEIDTQLAGLKQSIAGLKKAKVRTSVKLEEISRKAEPLTQRQDDIKFTLAKYKEYLSQNRPVEVAGKTLTPDKLKSNANKLTTAFRITGDELAGLERSRTELDKIVSSFEAKQQELNGHAARLQGKIEQIDSQMIAMRSLRDAKEIMGDSAATINDNVENLEAKVNNLLAEMRVELSVEGAMFDEASATKQVDEIDKLISDVQGPADTLSEIDQILASGS